MTNRQILKELNSCPYVYFCYLHGKIVLPISLKEGKEELKARKNGRPGMIEVFWGDNVVNFEWDKEKRKWKLPKILKAK